MKISYVVFKSLFFLLFVFTFFSNCFAQNALLINKEGKNVEARFLPPQGFERVKIEENSFATYLRYLPLKSYGSSVFYYNKEEKTKANVYCSVIDMEIGKRDLQQCADAVMRLRAEYLFENQRIKDIHFNFTSGDRADFTQYAEGYRAVIKGAKVSWQKSGKKDYTYPNFRNYLDLVFTYAGTLSLNKELKQVTVIQQIKIGDVFIQGGNPGHAVIVIDLVENTKTKEKLFLLAQSYMPAQDIQVLINPNDAKLSPWYSINFSRELVTPEWTFEKKNLKRFEGE